MWDYPDSINAYGVGYELRNCDFNFDLETILPRLLPANYCSNANPQKPWHQGNLHGLLTMGVCIYTGNVTEKLLSFKELSKHLQTEAQSTDFQIYARLNLHEKITADGGIQLAPSRWLKGLWKVTNLPGNSAACFFDEFEMSRILAQKYAETGVNWLVLPWDADALYLVNPAEVDWLTLTEAMREEL
ncbi:hypothetical protein HMPREF0044_1146 [Gleimia coleocanis DSM 15436]|uniref:Uncharacterized protein n=1 Tax=Gleimia coleocanis DSM 15436 TaxID=525245 RepID=C0W156_9ACTO|nr:hypothetical protein [Gleimia coleocanis]EEH63545.1 hypothetical protein HMPREF0044_1146 [Gleimia coleocanis DSM 15436]